MGDLAQPAYALARNEGNENMMPPVKVGTTSSRYQIAAADLAEHGPILLAAARMLVGREAEAQDLVQTTYEIALHYSDTLRDPDRLLPWLLRIQTREAWRLRRRLKRTLAMPGFRSSAAEPTNDRSLILREALAQLSPRERTAVVLHHMIGLSVNETARAMDVSPNTVKSQLKSALVRLRAEMK